MTTREVRRNEQEEGHQAQGRRAAEAGAAGGRIAGLITRLAVRGSLLVVRCGWHQAYSAWWPAALPFIIGVKRAQGAKGGFSDGLCRGCAQRLKADLAQRVAAARV